MQRTISTLVIVTTFVRWGPPSPPAEATERGKVERRLTDWPGAENSPRLSPDGSHLAFEATVDGNTDIYVREVETGVLQRVTTSAATDRRPSWSPDGGTLVFQSDRDGMTAAWKIPSTGGEATLVLGEPGRVVLAPDWSPKGELIAATVLLPDPATAWGSARIWVVKPDGTEARAVSMETGIWYPRFDQEGQWLYGYRGSDDIYAVHIVTGEIRPVSDGHYVGWRPVPSPDGHSVAFVSALGRWSVFVAPISSADAERHRPIQLDTVGEADFPSFSPDGSVLVFSSDRSLSHVYTVDVATGEQRPANVEGASPQLLADDRLAFFRPVEGQPRVHLLDRGEEARRARPLPIDIESVVDFAVSPSGDAIALTSQGYLDGNYDLWTARADGSGLSRLTDHGSAESPVWCDGGQSILVSSYGVVTRGPFRQVWRVRASDGAAEQLTHSPAHKRPTDCSADGRRITFHLTGGVTGVRTLELAEDGAWIETDIVDGQGGHWSPDGKRLAYVARGDGAGWLDLFVRNTDGSIVRLTNDTLVESWPRWSHDGRTVVFSARLPERDVWTVEIPELPWKRRD